MSLRVAQNIAAMSAHRWLEVNDNNMGKSIERLSSGFRINSAADDAAGLVLSEYLRTQVSGLTVASANTQDAINMFKTAEKSLDEIEVQLRNVRDLTLHAASSNGNSQAKAADQAQINQALDAINRIADQTEFAGMKLFDTGDNIDGKWFQIGANSGQQVQYNVAGSFGGVTLSADMHTSSLVNSGATATLASVESTTAWDGTTGGTDDLVITWEHPDGTTTIADFQITYAAADDADAAVDLINAKLAAEGYTDSSDPTVTDLNDVMEAYNIGGKIGIRLKDVYSNQDEYSTGSSLTVVSQGSVTAEGTQFGVPGIGDAGTAGSGAIDVESISSQADYDTVIDLVDEALNMVNGLRVNLGAFQKNNLESNLASLAVAKENLSASESAIRDTDMASEMVNFTRAQILSQAAQAMMSQANQAPQNILQMLK